MSVIKRNKRLIILLVVAIGLILLQLGAKWVFDPELLRAYAQWLDAFIAHNYLAAVTGYVAFYTMLVGALLPAAFFMTVAGGFLFGMWWGAFYANIGATLGATLSFLMVRYFFGKQVQERYRSKLAQFNQSMARDGTFYLLAIHLVAVVPFFLINLLCGLTQVSTWTFIWTTSLGIIPGSLVFTYAGSQLRTIHSLRDILSPRIFLVFALLALLSMLPVIFRKLGWLKNDKS